MIAIARFQVPMSESASFRAEIELAAAVGGGGAVGAVDRYDRAFEIGGASDVGHDAGDTAGRGLSDGERDEDEGEQ